MAAESSRITAQVVYNIETIEIRITEDKARNILGKHFEKISKSGDWKWALALFLSLLVALLTADFHSVLGLSSEIIKEVFVFLTLMSIFYLIRAIVQSLKNKDSVDDIINDMKGKTC